MKGISQLKARLEIEQQFAARLVNERELAKVFKALCDLGCEPAELQRLIVRLSSLPREKAKRRFAVKDRRRLEALARKLEQVAEELEPFYNLFFFQTWLVPEAERPPKGRSPIPIQPQLRQMAQQLRESAKKVKQLYGSGKDKTGLPDVNPAFLSGWRNFLLGDTHAAYEYIPFVVEYVQKKTGAPQIPELTTLIGAAIGDRDFNVEQLKMICYRRKRTTGKK